MRARPVDRRRRLGDSRSADPLLAAFRALDQQRCTRKGFKTVLEGPRRLRACGRLRGARSGIARERACARREILGILRGCGERADDFHRTRSKPDGSPAIAAVRAALADSGLGEDGIDYVNAHGTSTPENDKMEHLSLSTVFGERMRTIPISSNKSMIGHTLSAAGAIEAAFSLMTMREGVIPPTINYDNPDPAIDLDVVPNVKRAAERRDRAVQLLRLRRPEHLPCHGAGTGLSASRQIGFMRRLQAIVCISRVTSVGMRPNRCALLGDMHQATGGR